ncbi:hypothetical protein ACFUCQ_30620 [Streptomyces sp. NPDC057197]|uniref:hypothetical protein n=1 Tax=Streptomyces sp. NPDC057197 TaxID=3346045 RepID=UPI00363EFE26
MARRADRAAPPLDRLRSSGPPDALPFGGAYAAYDRLGPVVEGFLAAGEPGIGPFDVWVSSVGAPC